MWKLISVSLALLNYFFKDYLVNYWQSIIDTLTDTRSPAYMRFFLLIIIKIYRKYFLIII